jgi:hypothetical protein
MIFCAKQTANDVVCLLSFFVLDTELILRHMMYISFAGLIIVGASD